MQSEEKKSEVIVFAGPNGSGKSTITKLARITPATSLKNRSNYNTPIPCLPII